MYFHESQWDYPLAPGERIDHHYGYTNLLSAAASDACWFNSLFHLDAFLTSSKQFIDRMPDGWELHHLDKIESKSTVVPPGFQPTGVQRKQKAGNPIRIGWVARWEHDKRPDVFARLIGKIDAHEIPFQLVLLGPRRGNEPALVKIRQRYQEQILVDEYAQSREQYLQSLSKIDVVVSTADHEFFGIAICEAIDAGAAAVVPNRLSYPELLAGQECYNDIDEAVDMILRLTDSNSRQLAVEASKQSVQRFYADRCIEQLDSELEKLVLTH
jgi:glycosyltransferase involved in cell wall biosynthesis